jgi:hypothetical protein
MVVNVERTLHSLDTEATKNSLMEQLKAALMHMDDIGWSV